MKIYTGGGDLGKTSLFSGERVTKDDSRIEAYGDVDELNSAIGYLAALLPDSSAARTGELQRLQAELLQLSAWLAITSDAPAQAMLEELDETTSHWVEGVIDAMESQLTPLRHFILPGGQPAAAWAHVVRTICRRAERRLVTVIGTTPAGIVHDQLLRALVILNRLSDYLFVLARFCNHEAGIADTIWRQRRPLTA